MMIVQSAGQAWVGDGPQAWWFHVKGHRQR